MQVDSTLVVGLAPITGIPLLALVATRVAASIPARAADPESGVTLAPPQFPGWVKRTWLIAAMVVPMLSLDYATSPDAMIFWWSLAGPFSIARFGTGVSMLEASMMASILVAMTAAHPVRPSWLTALACISGFGAWFICGFGTVRAAV